MAEYPHVHTSRGLREEAERCFHLAAQASDKRLHDELLAYGKELIGRAEKMETMEKAVAKTAGE